jgi:hypothetical protein
MQLDRRRITDHHLKDSIGIDGIDVDLHGIDGGRWLEYFDDQLCLWKLGFVH